MEVADRWKGMGLHLGVYRRILLIAGIVCWYFNLDRSSNKMPAGIKAALAKAAEVEGGYSEEDAKKYVVTMVREGRLIEECWS